MLVPQVVLPVPGNLHLTLIPLTSWVILCTLTKLVCPTHDDSLLTLMVLRPVHFRDERFGQIEPGACQNGYREHGAFPYSGVSPSPVTSVHGLILVA